MRISDCGSRKVGVDLSEARALVITGAGISAESGIPTFRGKGGYWRNLDPTKLATPEAFVRDPKLVWEWYRERRQRIRDAQPNAAHGAIVRLSQRTRDFLLVTQNVDDLHARAGLPAEKIVQIHGDIFVSRCSRCDFARDDHGRTTTGIPKCSECGALMRPGVVWFGEQLDIRKIDIVEKFLDQDVDLTIVIGTTALFDYVVDWATRAGGELIEINPDETVLSRRATQSIHEPAAVALPGLLDRLAKT